MQHDCVRVYSDSQLEILQRVPVDTQLIRKIGSDAPAAMLYDAMDNFETGDAKGACRVVLCVCMCVCVCVCV